MRWQPNVTVAAVIEDNGKFLIVEELINNKIQINQPAGHWEFGETLVDAVIRETLEETGWDFEPASLVGIYQWQHPEKDQTTYLRFAFCGKVTKHHPDVKLDDGIIQAIWLSREEIVDRLEQHRSPQLLLCIDDYLKGKKTDLSLLTFVE